jgi:hypothetical protein
MESASLKNITLMTVFIMALATAQRRSELHALSYEKISFNKERANAAVNVNPAPPYPGIDAKSTSNRRQTLDDAVLFYCLLPGDLVNKCW